MYIVSYLVVNSIHCKLAANLPIGAFPAETAVQKGAGGANHHEKFQEHFRRIILLGLFSLLRGGGNLPLDYFTNIDCVRTRT